MTQMLLETDGLTVRFGGHVAVDAVSCGFRAGELTAIVGPNGAGKTTYFNLISGQVTASAGTVRLMGEDVTRDPVAQRCRKGLGRAFQLTNLFPNLTVLENVRLVIQPRRRMGFNLFSMASSHRELTVAAMAILERVRLHPLSEQKVGGLSHGNQRKLEVAILIALDPVVYMFDEPTAGMSVDEAPVVLDLIAELKAEKDRTILLVEHKMDVIRSLADRIIVLHNGALAADGDPATVMASDVVQEAYMGRDLADVDPILELSGIHTDIAQYHILQGVDLIVPRGGVTMLLGRNGVGKTTTLRTIIGHWQAKSGSLRFDGADMTGMPTPARARAGIGFVPEDMGIFSDLTVEENMILAAASGPLDPARMEWVFEAFPPLRTFWRSEAGNLSGGQKQMLSIARAMAEERQLYLIDEPTKGLAPAIISTMAGALRDLKNKGASILLVEQNFAVAKALGDTAAVMDDGRIVWAGQMAELAGDDALQEQLMGLSMEAH